MPSSPAEHSLSLSHFLRVLKASFSEAQYEPSVVENFNKDPENKDTYVDPSQRKSETAWLADGDAVVDCVKTRAAEFQGFAPNKSIEELAVLKYKPGGSFTPHYDCMYDPFTSHSPFAP